jgi:hypothetical protein
VIQTVLNTGAIKIPIKHNILEEAIGRNITTTLLTAIIPELLRTYGNKPVDMLIAPLAGTQIKWSAINQEHELHF